MLKQEQELGLEVTVTEEEIQSCIERAEKIESELRAAESEKKDDKYFIFKPPSPKEKHVPISHE